MSGADESVRRLGDGYEPHVDEVDRRLIYSLPVDSSFVSTAFEFDIDAGDLAVLQVDRFRRAALYMVLHAVLQRSMIRGNPRVTQDDFCSIANRVLHSAEDELTAFLADTGRRHNMDMTFYIEQELRRQG